MMTEWCAETAQGRVGGRTDAGLTTYMEEAMSKTAPGTRFGYLLREGRLAKGMTQAEAAALPGVKVNVMTLSGWERQGLHARTVVPDWVRVHPLIVTLELNEREMRQAWLELADARDGVLIQGPESEVSACITCFGELGSAGGRTSEHCTGCAEEKGVW